MSSWSEYTARSSRCLVIPISEDIFDAVNSLSDYLWNMQAEDFVSRVFSILLYTTISKDFSEGGHAFTRLTLEYRADNEVAEQSRWGEFLLLMKVFVNRLSCHDWIVEELKELIPPYSRFVAEEMFEVTVSKNCTSILVR